MTTEAASTPPVAARNPIVRSHHGDDVEDAAPHPDRRQQVEHQQSETHAILGAGRASLAEHGISPPGAVLANSGGIAIASMAGVCDTPGRSPA